MNNLAVYCHIHNPDEATQALASMASLTLSGAIDYTIIVNKEDNLYYERLVSFITDNNIRNVYLLGNSTLALTIARNLVYHNKQVSIHIVEDVLFEEFSDCDILIQEAFNHGVVINKLDELILESTP